MFINADVNDYFKSMLTNITQMLIIEIANKNHNHTMDYLSVKLIVVIGKSTGYELQLMCPAQYLHVHVHTITSENILLALD